MFSLLNRKMSKQATCTKNYLLPLWLSKNVNWVRVPPQQLLALTPTWSDLGLLLRPHLSLSSDLVPCTSASLAFLHFLSGQVLHMQIPKPRALPSQVNPIPNLSYHQLIFHLFNFCSNITSHITVLAWVLPPSTSVLSLCPSSHSLDLFNWLLSIHYVIISPVVIQLRTRASSLLYTIVSSGFRMY